MEILTHAGPSWPFAGGLCSQDGPVALGNPLSSPFPCSQKPYRQRVTPRQRAICGLKRHFLFLGLICQMWEGSCLCLKVGTFRKSPQTSKSIVYSQISSTPSPLNDIYCFLILGSSHFYLPSARCRGNRSLVQQLVSSKVWLPSVLKVSSDFVMALGGGHKLYCVVHSATAPMTSGETRAREVGELHPASECECPP